MNMYYPLFTDIYGSLYLRIFQMEFTFDRGTVAIEGLFFNFVELYIHYACTDFLIIIM